MEKAKCIVLFYDLLEEDLSKTEDHFGILFENGWILCLCCGGWLEPDDYKIIKKYDGFAYLDETLKSYFE